MKSSCLGINLQSQYLYSFIQDYLFDIIAEH